MSRDDASIADILKAARLIQQFIADKDRAAFDNDPQIQSAVIYQLLIIGEATKRLSESFRDTQTAIPWRGMAGMRDVLIHGYDIVDLDQVWDSAHDDIPILIAALEPLLPPQAE
jgi:uncharacterized protein with HEPN domain